MQNQATLEKIRLDKWLWTSRFFKTRKLAYDEVVAGHVIVNGSKSKPAKMIGHGDQLRIRRGIELFTITICGISKNRLPASQINQLFIESEESIIAREEATSIHRLNRQGVKHDRRKPNKKQRQESRKFKQQLPVVGSTGNN